MNGSFESDINTAVILEDSYRFGKDQEYGILLEKFWTGNVSFDDILPIHKLLDKWFHLAQKMT